MMYKQKEGSEAVPRAFFSKGMLRNPKYIGVCFLMHVKLKKFGGNAEYYVEMDSDSLIAVRTVGLIWVTVNIT